ncbi:MAG: hypothetical protein HY665_03110 [Chloroflexi bacterium]|nr:hypothetical protein [Chloroflexota bacterium]
MNVAKQLYQLQEVDLEIESSEQAIRQTESQLGESPALVSARERLGGEQKRLEDLARQQRSIEWEIDDITSKLKKDEEELYSERIRNAKELSNLKQDADGLKARRRQLEDKALDLMEEVEAANRSITALDCQFKDVEAEWEHDQKELSDNLERLNTTVAGAKQKRQSLAAGIEPQIIKVYQELKKQKGTAVAKVEQGMCRGCRISLPVTEIQRARSGELARCSSCGRILYSA